MTTTMPRRPKCSASFVQRRPAICPGRSAFDAVERVEHHVEVLGRGRHVLDDVVVEGDEADAVALLVHEVGEARGQELARSRAW